jgi:hypothetical protein
LGQVSEGCRSSGSVGSTSATKPQRGQTRRGNWARSTKTGIGVSLLPGWRVTLPF